MPLALEELGECLPASCTLDEKVELHRISQILDRFLRTLPERDCCIFLRRYWYVDGIRDIALRYDMAEGSVKSSLHRTRQKLRVCLEREGVQV